LFACLQAEYQKTQAEIKRRKGQNPDKNVSVPSPTASSLLYADVGKTAANCGLKLAPVLDGHLLAGHFRVVSIDVDGPSNNGMINIDDVLLKIDGVEVSGKSKAFVESKLEVKLDVQVPRMYRSDLHCSCRALKGAQYLSSF
jgi:hypothetical protein